MSKQFQEILWYIISQMSQLMYQVLYELLTFLKIDEV